MECASDNWNQTFKRKRAKKSKKCHNTLKNVILNKKCELNLQIMRAQNCRDRQRVQFLGMETFHSNSVADRTFVTHVETYASGAMKF